MTNTKQTFSSNFAKDAEFVGGLRGYFEYRDLGIDEATNGQYHAAISRVRPGEKGDLNIRTTGLHRHLCDFQMFYVLKGWVTMYYEGQGEMTFHQGDNCLQPAGVVHNEIQCSADFQCLEIYSPAKHETVVVEGEND